MVHIILVRLSDIMLSYWSNFAKYGNPNGEGLETWDKWDSNKNNLLELGEVIQVIPEKYIGAYQIIDEWNRRTK